VRFSHLPPFGQSLRFTFFSLWVPPLLRIYPILVLEHVAWCLKIDFFIPCCPPTSPLTCFFFHLPFPGFPVPTIPTLNFCYGLRNQLRRVFFDSLEKSSVRFKPLPWFFILFSLFGPPAAAFPLFGGFHLLCPPPPLFPLISERCDKDR